MATQIRAEFEARFLDQFAGTIVRDPQTAIVELVANAWDAYATKVKIKWPEHQQFFSIEDNGIGLTDAQFRNIWKRFSYDRIEHGGEFVHPPPDLKNYSPRRVFGRNGKGRLAGFYFADSYQVETWRDGTSNTFSVVKADPFLIRPISTKERRGHGLRLTVDPTKRLEMSAPMVRQLIGNRFLIDPQFQITVNGTPVTFADLPKNRVAEHRLVLDDANVIDAIVIDSSLPHETTQTHGIAWWVDRRSVGSISWSWPPNEPLLDGRSSEAKRYSIILIADCMREAVRSDWSGFDTRHELWTKRAPVIREFVGDILRSLTAQQRGITRDRAVAASKSELEQLTKIDRDKWAETLDTLMDRCPNLSETEITQVMNILAKMEVADSQYSMLAKLESMDPSDFDGWNDIFQRWSASAAKIVLGEIETRLKLVAEINRLTKERGTDEVQELQPLFKRGLWVFGPEYDSIEYTSNETVATIVRKFAGGQSASRLRPDFVLLDDASVGFYSVPAFGDDHAEVGIQSIVIVELKKPGIPIGSKEKEQVWKYVKELLSESAIQASTRVNAFVLGETIADYENEPLVPNRMTSIKPMTYPTFISRAESRLFKLREKIQRSEAGTKALSGHSEVDLALRSLLF